MPPRKADPEERRHQILTAATTLFAEKGFHQATMNDIVKASGLSKGGVYWHFDSKDAIVLAILEQVFTIEVPPQETQLEAPDTAAERIQNLLAQSAAEITTLKTLLPIFYEFYALAPRSAEVRAVIGRYFEHYKAILAQLLAQGITAGEFAPHDTAQVAKLLIAQVEGLLLLWVLSNMETDLTAECQQAIKLYLAGLTLKDVNQ